MLRKNDIAPTYASTKQERLYVLFNNPNQLNVVYSYY